MDDELDFDVDDIDIDVDDIDVEDIEMEDISDEDLMDDDEPTNPVEDMIDAIASDEFNSAETLFQDVLGSKLSDELEMQRINIGSNMFATAEAE
jgi:hypothetical protein|tara:strand:+ start:87 stop:368 length:282 start_codon:yes stop_codon:yes gene_type:complete